MSRFESVIFAGALALSACVTVPEAPSKDFGPVDQHGFVTRANGAIFHPGTGLYCPSEMRDLTLSTWHEFNPGVDTSCSYTAESRLLTLYAYASEESLQDELNLAGASILQQKSDPDYAFDEELSQACIDAAGQADMMAQLLGAVRNLDESDDNSIEINVSGQSDIPYGVVAMTGAELETYAAVSRSSDWTVKARYTKPLSAKTNDDEASPGCRLVYSAIRSAVRSLGQVDGSPESDDPIARLLLRE